MEKGGSVTVADLSASRMAAALREREVSAVELLQTLLARIARVNPALNAIVTLDVDRAMQRAREADESLAGGRSWGPLHGVPFTLKDCFQTAGVRTTAGHPPLAEYLPDVDSTVAARLKAAGAILLGKSNVPPLAMSAQTNNEIFGRTSNPWDVTRTSGGSSGGAAAAVAARLVPFDIGSDTVNMLPRPMPSLCAVTVPPCISTSRFTRGRPMPSPPPDFSRVRVSCMKRSNT